MFQPALYVDRANNEGFYFLPVSLKNILGAESLTEVNSENFTFTAIFLHVYII